MHNAWKFSVGSSIICKYLDVSNNIVRGSMPQNNQEQEHFFQQKCNLRESVFQFC